MIARQVAGESKILDLEGLGIPPAEAALVELALRVTKWPKQTSSEDVGRLIASSGNSSELILDAMAIISGFNFINRIADGLGVRYDVPKIFMTEGLTGRFFAPLISMAIRSQVAFERQEIPHQSANENLGQLERLFGENHLGTLPHFVRHLAAAPHLLETQKLLLGASLANMRQEEAIGRPVATAVHEMLAKVGAVELGRRVERWSASMPCADASERFRAVLRFACKVGDRAYTTVLEDIEELRKHSIPDVNILDVVFAVAIWAAFGRLERLADGLPDATLQQPVAFNS